MGPWSKIDALRDRVAKIDVIDFGPIRSLEDAQGALGKSGLAPDRLVVFGWEIFLSRRRQDGVVLWHLSAKLHPHGRASTEDDWKVVGRIAAQVGAPRDPVLMPDEPSAAVHWSWIAQ